MAKVSAMRISGDDSRSTNAFEHERNLSFLPPYSKEAHKSNLTFSIQAWQQGSVFTPYLFAGCQAFTLIPEQSIMELGTITTAEVPKDNQNHIL